MFSRIKRRIRDMSTIRALCEAAEKHAVACGQKEPGAEHFVLAALELPDGTARRAFERLHVAPDGFRAAIDRQYADALRNVGFEPSDDLTSSPDDALGHENNGLYRAQASAQVLMQQLADRPASEAEAPLVGAHVVIAATNARFGVAARSFRAMGIEAAQLAAAAAAEIEMSNVH